MADIGGEKVLLLLHAGGDFTVRLHRTPPWYWPVLRTVTTALDHTAFIHHAQGSLAPGWIASGVLMLIVTWVYVRNRPFQARSLLLAVGAGLVFTALPGGYALARRAHLTILYTQWLRTMDRTFELSPSVLITTFLMSTGGAWLYLHARTRWGRDGAFCWRSVAVLVSAVPTACGAAASPPSTQTQNPVSPQCFPATAIPTAEPA